MPVALMGCATGAGVVAGSSSLVTVGHEAVNGHRLVVMKPADNALVRFVSHKQRGFVSAPSIDNASILLNVAAAFTLDTLSLDVCGDHVVAGEHIKGYADVTATGHMLILDNKVAIKSNDRLDESIKAAVDGKGYLFQQCLIVEDGRGVVERIPKAIVDRRAHIIYRAACVMSDGSFAIVQSAEPIYCHEFVDALVAIGARQALYLDMGTWAWGWVREKDKPTQELDEHYFNTRYQSNWLQIVTPRR